MKKFLTMISLSIFAVTFAQANQTTLQKNLQKNYPEMNAKVTGSTPFNGVYEVNVGNQIVYTDEKGQYFFVGNLVDFKNKENLTAKREQQLNKIDVSKLPLDQAIKQVKGNGQRVLYIFSDPDCPYCQQLEKELTSIDNVTIYLFLYPLKTLHPNAETVAKQIWCSSDRYAAWEDHMINQQAPTALPNCSNPISKNLTLGQTLKINGTPTIFLKDGQRISGAREAADIEALLGTQK
ncbi:DsbC family protein [Acinetobacter puyangensis]|uniref:Thiol:disulfide interchange protein n=1 Tax=Acinetobacter puyangensis TaxID=1096779 RepID=A0A240E845_9GAMM|nr:DsbC family protein [Acinetobacter puyangensis]SNX44691.1 thiol:disulfide interchange protein DsbC [Acinetobacter puyangensis]